MFEYKEDIVSTRKGCVGSSDAAMLMQVSNLSFVPKSAYGRMAICKGLAENEDNLHTSAVEYGNETEMAIYEHLKTAIPDAPYESNPRWESVRYSRKNVKCIAHPDIVLIDKVKKIINVYEVKTSKLTTEEVRRKYKPQLYFQSLLAKEKAAMMGSGWSVRMFLVHYCTSGLDIESGINQPFDPNRLSVNRVICHSGIFDLGKAMDIVDAFLENMTADTVQVGEVVEAEYLPEPVKERFVEIAATLREIKERERKVEDFKKKLYDFLVSHGVKKVSCRDFSFTVVEPTTITSFDAKGWWEEFSSKLSSEEADEIIKAHTKKVNKKGYITISVNENK